MLDHARRFAEAVALGHIADLEFQEECERCGIDPAKGSPLDVVGELERPFVLGRHNS